MFSNCSDGFFIWIYNESLWSTMSGSTLVQQWDIMSTTGCTRSPCFSSCKCCKCKQFGFILSTPFISSNFTDANITCIPTIDNWNRLELYLFGIPHFWRLVLFFSLVLFFYILKQIFIFRCSGQGCFAVKLQKCFVDFETQLQFFLGERSL